MSIWVSAHPHFLSLAVTSHPLSLTFFSPPSHTHINTLLLLSALLIGIKAAHPHKADGCGQLCCYWAGQSQSLKWVGMRGVVIGKGLRGRRRGDLAPLWMALTSRDRWCWSNDSSSILAFWPACILNSLADWLFRFNWKGFTRAREDGVFPPNQPIMLNHPTAPEVRERELVTCWCGRLIIFDEFCLKDWFELGG